MPSDDMDTIGRASEMKNMRDAGKSLAEIARVFGISSSRVGQILIKHDRMMMWRGHAPQWVQELSAVVPRACAMEMVGKYGSREGVINALRDGTFEVYNVGKLGVQKLREHYGLPIIPANPKAINSAIRFLEANGYKVTKE